MGDSPTTLACPEWCERGPHGAPACHERAIETIVLKDGIIRVSLTQQEPIHKSPHVSVFFHAHGADYNGVHVASIRVWDASILATALAAAETLEGRDAATQVFLGTQGGALAHAMFLAAREAGVYIPRVRAGRGSGRPNPPPTLADRLGNFWWKVTGR